MITFIAILVLMWMTKDGISSFDDTDFIMMCIIAHSIANEVAILIKGR